MARRSKLSYPNEVPKSWNHFHRGRKYGRKSLAAERRGDSSQAEFYQSMMLAYYMKAGAPIFPPRCMT